MMVSMKGVEKRFGPVQALPPVDLEIDQGELFGLIGPDGAGKSTLLRILATVLLPDAGEANVMGHDVRREYRILRTRTGYMPGRFSLYQDLSVIENLRFFAAVFGADLDEALARVDDIYHQLRPFADRRAGALSGGMKQKLALCCALVHQPELLILDEPTTGVDAVSRREFWDMLGKLHRGGMTIVVSTPYMDEASRCTRVALMQAGTIMRTGSPQDLLRQHHKVVYAVETAEKYRALQLLRGHMHVDHVYAFGETLHYTDRRGVIETDLLRHWLEEGGMREVRVQRIEPGIEDVFIDLMTEVAHGVATRPH